MAITDFAVCKAPEGRVIALVEQGLARGGLKRPEDAKLHLGIAYLQSGNKTRALSMLKTVQGSDGVADLARLWVVHAR